MNDRSRSGSWLCERWQAFLCAPRWRWIQPERMPFRAVAVLFHGTDPAQPPDDPDGSTAANPPDGLGDISDLLTLAEAYADPVPEPMTLLGVRSRDGALMRLPLGGVDHASLCALYKAARDGTVAELEDGIASGPWALASADLTLSLGGARSILRAAIAHQLERSMSLLGRAANFRVIPANVPSGVDVIRARERWIVRRLRALLIDALDHTAIRALRRGGAAINGATYNALATAGDRRLWREQALTVYPAPLSVLIAHGDGSEGAEAVGNVDRTHCALAECVDAGAPLTPWLATVLKVPAETVRAAKRTPVRRMLAPRVFFGETPADASDLGPTEIGRIYRMLALTDVRQRPVSASQWRSYVRMVAALSSADRAMARLGPERAHAWTLTLRRHLARPVKEQVRLVGMDDYTSELHDLDHVFASMLRVLELQDATAGPVRDRLARLSVRELVEVSRRWHDAVQDYDRAGLARAGDSAVGGVIAWPSLVGTIELGARVAIELTDSDQLRDEGLDLQHCAGTYVTKCLFSRTHLFSLRDRAGRRMSTLEVEIDADYALASIVQHRAQQNREPDEDCARAARELVARVPSIVDRARAATLAAALLQRQTQRDRIESSLDAGRAAYALRQALPRAALRYLAHPAAHPGGQPVVA